MKLFARDAISQKASFMTEKRFYDSSSRWQRISHILGSDLAESCISPQNHWKYIVKSRTVLKVVEIIVCSERVVVAGVVVLAAVVVIRSRSSRSRSRRGGGGPGVFRYFVKRGQNHFLGGGWGERGLPKRFLGPLGSFPLFVRQTVH